MPAPERRPAALDMVVGGAALVGSWLLLHARRRRLVIPAGIGEAAIDNTARAGRGRRGTPPSREAKRLGYEPTDADARTIGLAMLGLAAVAIAAVLGMLLLLGLLHRQLQADRPTYTAEQSTLIDPPGPQLEAHPQTDLQRQDAGERALLDRYAWADKAHTRARIPIARAMLLVVGRPLDAVP